MAQKFDIYNENVLVTVLRDQTPYVIPFCKIRDGDVVFDREGNPWFTADGNAHVSGDANYGDAGGWQVNDEEQGYFPEDFGASLVQSKDEPDEEETEEDAVND